MNSIIELAYKLRELLHAQGYKNVGTLVQSADVAGLLIRLGEDISSWRQIMLSEQHLLLDPEKLAREIAATISDIN